MVGMTTVAAGWGRPYTAADLAVLRPDGDLSRRYELIDGVLLVTPMTPSGEFTWAEVEAMPDDGRRRELIDGVLVVTPGPRFVHQELLGELYAALRRRRLSGIEILFAPFDVDLDERSHLQPDLLVAPRSAFAERSVAGPSLLLAVEILSPSTRRLDLTLKHDRYAALGCPSYWVLDPDEPSITAWELHEGVYVEVAHAVGAQTCTLTRPFPVEVVPSALVGPPG